MLALRGWKRTESPPLETVAIAVAEHGARADRSVEPAPTPVVELVRVSKTFPGAGRAAVAGLSLALLPGEILAVLGPSGCGKTTTLRLIAGFEQPDAGTIEIAGKVVVGGGTFVQPERRRVGMVFQEHALFPHLTVAQNVAFGLARSRRREQRVMECLDLVGLKGYGERLPHQLSGGQQQRVALARALVTEPALILGDEPTGNLDSRAGDEIVELLRRAADEWGRTVVIVTHDPRMAAHADRIVFLRDGRIVDQNRLARAGDTGTAEQIRARLAHVAVE